MIQELYQKAIQFSGEKHSEQKVPGSNANYVLHLSNVAMEVLMAYQNTPDFDLAFAIQLALLHDTLEDTSTTFKTLEKKFGIAIAEGVSALTKDETLPTKTERMLDSLKRINTLEKEVGLVKLADRITNLQRPPKHWNTAKIHAYGEEAKLIYQQLQDKNTYLADRLKHKIEDYKKYAD
ncbi:HD domain-containing protein [Formosa algae]|uniref:HD domain-containing protein n=1 Tax=Formosa algae TaxID=225843 RepID=UPI000CCF371E|nr:HD domain-containing protein [Formosa algae]PNW29147.1 guanosine polyphosphate pyrophosphohydrolase [Formosa algae]